ncbi:MAG: AbrB/MazE/SpoVT family DNA-binding domain-containing protein [Clostridiaceae bacterium]|nr:AbrB/MazE/SpoVT family DNA-binding domain-containing protein [Clostridiaceae bacterium]
MLKATGIVRRVDELGRIVIPMEIRQIYDIKTKDSIEIFVNDDKIVLRKYQPACIFCGNAQDVIKYQERMICKDCLSEISEKYA